MNMANIMQLSTGDLKNNLRKLQNQLRSIQCPHELDLNGIIAGSPTAYLPLYHYALLEYSKPISLFLVERKIELFAKSDRKFIETMFHALRELFNYRPPLNKYQFFTNGFVECKVIMCVQILHLIHTKHVELTPGVIKSRKCSDKSSRTEAGVSGNYRETGSHLGLVGSNNGLSRADVTVLSHLSGGVLHSNVKNLSSSNHAVPTILYDRDLSVNDHQYSISATNSVKSTNPISSSPDNAVGCKSENCIRKLGAKALKDNTCERQSDASDEGKQLLAEASRPNKSVVFKKGSVSVVRESSQPGNGISGISLSHGNQIVHGVGDGRSVPDDKSRGEHWIAKNDSENFLFNVLSSVSQTLLELVKRVDSVSERVSRLETSVSRQSSNLSVNSENDCDSFEQEHHYNLNKNGESSRSNQLNLNGGINTSSKSLSITESQLTNSQARNESKENDLSKILKETEGKLLQSLNTINARITLLENSVTLLNSHQQQSEQQQHHQSEQEQRCQEQAYRQQYLDESKQPYSQMQRSIDRKAHLLETEEFIEGIESPKSAESWSERVKDWRSGGDWRSADGALRSVRNGSSTNSIQDYEMQNTRFELRVGSDNGRHDSRLPLHSNPDIGRQDLRLELPEPTNDDSLLTVDSCQSSHPATPPSLRNSSRIVESSPTKVVDYNEQAQRIEAMLQSTHRLLSNNTT